MQPQLSVNASVSTCDVDPKLARFLGFLAQDPDNLSLRSQTIAMAIAAGDWVTAEALTQEGLSKHPEALELLAHAGFLALREQDYARAQRQLTAALHRGLELDSVRYNLGFAEFFLGDYEAAFATLSAIPLTAASYAGGILLIARCLHHLGKREQAIDTLLGLSARNDEADGLLALLLQEVGRTEEAQKAADRALASAPQQLDALLARAGSLMEQESFEQALQDYTTATQAHPKIGRAWAGLALLKFRDFKFDEALASLQKAVEFMPDHIGTWHTLAWIHILQGNVTEAKKAFNEAYEIDRNFGETHGGLAVVAAMQDQTKLAEEHIKRATRLNPDGFAAHYASMLLLEKQGKAADSRKLFDKIMSTQNSTIGRKPEELVQLRLLELAKRNAH